MSQKKKGMMLSYINLIMGMVVNIFLTPMLITTLGDTDYSLYKVIHSFAGPLAMFHLGVSTVVTRSIVKNKECVDGGIGKKQNTMAMSLGASVLMALIVAVAAMVMYMAIPDIYGNTYSDVSVLLGQKIFVMFVASSILHMLTDAFSGCVVGHERYVVSGMIPLFKTVGKLILQMVLLRCGLGVVYVVAVDLIIALGIFLFTVFYAVCVLRETPKFHYFDKKQFIEIVLFGMAILLQAFVNQVNNNMDIMILGAFITEKAVITMYSSALAVYSIYNSLISVVTQYFLPQATKLTMQNASGREMTNFIIKPGRFQAIIAVACIGGFALFGNNFISIWIGAQYMDAYGVVLVLMIPVTIPLVENAVICILDATMKRMFRSVVLVVMAMLNLIASIILVQWLGFWGAAVGTVISLFVGHGVLMNVYYAKVFNIEIFRMFRQIFKGILPAGGFSAVLCLPLALFLPNTALWFIIKCCCFVVVYALCLLTFGLNSDEKLMIRSMIRNFRHK